MPSQYSNFYGKGGSASPGSSAASKRGRSSEEGNKIVEEAEADQQNSGKKHMEKESEKKRENGLEEDEDDEVDDEGGEADENDQEDFAVHGLEARAKLYRSEADYAAQGEFTTLNLIRWGEQPNDPGGSVVVTWQENSPDADFTKYVPTIRAADYYIVCDLNDNDPKQEHCGSNIPQYLWGIIGFPLQLEGEEEEEEERLNGQMSEKDVHQLGAENAQLMEKEWEEKLRLLDLEEQRRRQEEENDSDSNDSDFQDELGGHQVEDSGQKIQRRWKSMQKKTGDNSLENSISSFNWEDLDFSSNVGEGGGMGGGGM